MVASANPRREADAGRLTLSAGAARADGTDSPNGLVVNLSSVTAGYRRRVALENVSLSVPAGAMLALIGPNGSGKSTLLKLLLGLLSPWSGTVSVLGETPRASRVRVGYVPQAAAGDWNFPATVGEVVMMGRYGRLGLFRRPTRADREAVSRALERVGMAERIGDQVGELSGGQQQRTFVARALVQEPRILLLDEPLSGVDAVTEQDVYALLRQLRDTGVTVLFTTHNLSTVAQHFDMALFLNRRLIAVGPPHEVFNEHNLRAAYGPSMALVKIGDRYFAVDTGDHHAESGSPHG